MAKKVGASTIYHLPIAYWRRFHEIMKEEAELQPEWAPTLTALTDTPEKLVRKERELLNADQIVVPSHFVADSIAAYCRCKRNVHVIPYGYPQTSDRTIERREPSGKLRVLYAGQLTQRKGLAYLFEALERLSFPHVLLLAGSLATRNCAPLNNSISRANRQWVGVLSRDRLRRKMEESHVFVFPTLAEGCAMVVPEALATGLPVITTQHSGASDLIEDGREGFIVPIRDPDAIAERLTYLYENEDERQRMAEAARAKAARERWARFRRAVGDVLKEACR